MTWRGRNIYLVGLPGAGKTSIGRELASLLAKSGYTFLDMDSEIERRAGQSIAQIFDGLHGEPHFRDLETQVLLEAANSTFDHKPKVIATGGGTILRPINRAAMRGSGVVVWVDVNVRQAAKQVVKSILEGAERPLLRSSSVEELTAKLRKVSEERQRYYEQSTLHFVTRSLRGDERTQPELAAELLNALEQMSRHVRLRPRFQTILAKSALGDYPVEVGSGIAMSELALAIRDLGATNVLILTDQNVAKLHGGKLMTKLSQELGLRTTLQQLALKPGEPTKNEKTLFTILSRLEQSEFDRKTGLVLTFGGGVVSDIGGLAASLHKRGIPLIHVPTTLLGQIDAAIGGKTGIDHAGVKNLLGTIYAPRLVLVDPLYLKTLPKRELHAGLAELFKYALIGNSDLWGTLSKSVRRLVRGVDASYELLIRDAIREKLRYVGEDEFERASGVREMLNFGHTFGHALEAATGFADFLHGEAVLLGMRAAAWLSLERGMLSEDEWREIELVLGRIPVEPSITVPPAQILQEMKKDKKRISGTNRVILLNGIGSATMQEGVSDAALLSAIEFMISIN